MIIEQATVEVPGVWFQVKKWILRCANTGSVVLGKAMDLVLCELLGVLFQVKKWFLCCVNTVGVLFQVKRNGSCVV